MIRKKSKHSRVLLGHKGEHAQTLAGSIVSRYVPLSQRLTARSYPAANRKDSFWHSFPAGATVLCS